MDSAPSVYLWTACACDAFMFLFSKSITDYHMALLFCCLAFSGIVCQHHDLKETFVQMKNLALYKIPIGYMLIYVVLILASGLWLFLLSQGLDSSEGMLHTIQTILHTPKPKSLHNFIEVAAPHMFAIGALIFVLAHFMLFSTKISQKVSLIVSMTLFVLALLNIFSYLAISFGLLVSGWIKLVSLLGFVLLFLVLLGMVAFSL